MQPFAVYFKLGYHHITDLGGYDHLLFLVALCCMYRPQEWRQVAILVTAFTLGHSLTLALSVLLGPIIPSHIIEFLIPLTILTTCIWNAVKREESPSPNSLLFKYAAALLFGLIHGMGFSNFLMALLGPETSIVLPLLAFNLGLEIGQLLIVAIIMSISALFILLLKTPRREWILFISGGAAGISLLLAIEKSFW